MEGDLIGAFAAAVTAFLYAQRREATWSTALVTLKLVMCVMELLIDAPSLPGADASVIDAGWKRCAEVRLVESVITVPSACFPCESW